MSPNVKLTVYAVLVILCAWFAWGFYSNTNAVTKVAATLETNTAAMPETNAAAPETNTAAMPATNAAALPATNAPTAQTNAPAPARHAAPKPEAARDENAARSAVIGYLAALVGTVIVLGLLIAIDVTHFVGNQAVDFLFDDIGEAPRDPDYERAEAEWANGKHLDAIQIMRDFLKTNPRCLYATLRIAEIYEKDLKNPLAAALEYEEALKHRLPPEKWGWTAIHLCNLYSRLNQGDKALALLRRIADEYPKTRAAKKARAHLGIAEPEPEQAPAVVAANPATEQDMTEEDTVFLMEERPPELEPRQEAPPAPPKSPEPPKANLPPKSNLPPGFRAR